MSWGDIPKRVKVRDIELEDYQARARELLATEPKLNDFEHSFLESAQDQDYGPTEKQTETLERIERKFCR